MTDEQVFFSVESEERIGRRKVSQHSFHGVVCPAASPDYYAANKKS